MKTSVVDKFIYFGKIPDNEVAFVDQPAGWEGPYYYRIEVDSFNEFISFQELGSANKVDIKFSAINELTNAVAKLQAQVVCAIIGAPLQNNA